MTGIVFFNTEDLDSISTFYTETVGATVWVEQPACTILQFHNLLFGFCERDETETDGILTFVTPSRSGVDEFYERFQDRAHGKPSVNETFDIYQFFADDPDGRTMEFQTFLHETDPI